MAKHNRTIDHPNNIESNAHDMTPNLPSHETLAAILAAIFGISELIVFRLKRSNINSKNKDQGSLRILARVIFCSVGLALISLRVVQHAQLDILVLLSPVGAVIFVIGLALRWFAIVYLGRFFTVNVAIATDHKVIDTGPYRIIRHPSYTGMLMIWLGIGMCSGNFLTLLIILVPPTIALLYRIAIEETALSEALGRDYVDYMSKTKRLIPFVY